MSAAQPIHPKQVTAVDISAPCSFTDDQGITWRGHVIAKARHADHHQLRLVRSESGRVFWVPYWRITWEVLKS